MTRSTNSGAESKLKRIIAEDIMTDGVEVVKPDMNVSQVAHLMLRKRISGYPIVDDDGAVVGIVTLTDLFILMNKMSKTTIVSADDQSDALCKRIAECKNMPIADIMSKTVITIAPETTIAEIIDAVVKWGVHTFPVMKDGKLIGIVGRHDILNATYVYG